MALETVAGGAAFLLGRLLFGGILGFMGLNHFLQFEAMSRCEAHRGIPAPRIAVGISGALLIGGGFGIIVGAFPVLSAAAIAVFLVVSALTMRDSRNADDPQERQTEMTQFLKNAALAGGAFTLLAIGGINWPFAIGLRLPL